MTILNSVATTKAVTAISNLLIPGTGYVQLGKIKTALTIQFILLASLIFICWSGLVFSGLHLFIFVLSILIYHITTAIHALYINPKNMQIGLFNWIACIAFSTFFLGILGITFIYKSYLLGAELYFIPSMSMYPTIKPGQFILVDTKRYHESKPELGDIVIIKRDSNTNIVKRIHRWPMSIPNHKNEYYVLGDNKASSYDSRKFGGISGDRITGKAKLVVLSIDNNQNIVPGDFLLTIN